MGKAKRTYDADTINFNKTITNELKQMHPFLPTNYNSEDILGFYKIYYPYSWELLVQRQKLYTEKSAYLKRTKGYRNRYNIQKPEQYFYSLQKVKHMMSRGAKQKHYNGLKDDVFKRKKEAFKTKRKTKNERLKRKREEARKNTQSIDPEYLELYIQMYHRKGSQTREKMEIVTELKKFDTEKVTRFFYKLNDAEHNNQIRRIAFEHLQEMGYYVKLRKNFKGNVKSYQIEESSMDSMTPHDLYCILKNKGIQDKKKYDIFISHSSKDKKLVREVITKLNKMNKVCYCDWTMDNDYLKRKYAGKYTKKILQVRMEQSKELIFVRTENSVLSDWVKFELDYFNSLNKIIYVIDNINDDYNEFSNLIL